MWNVLEHSFAFYRRNNGPSNGKSLASHDFEEHHIANGDVSMQGKKYRKENKYAMEA